MTPRPARRASPKSSTFARAALADGDVGGFQIAMDHAALVRVPQRRRDLLSVANDGLGGKAIFRDQLGERPPSTNSIAMNARPPISPTSYTVQMCG